MVLRGSVIEALLQRLNAVRFRARKRPKSPLDSLRLSSLKRITLQSPKTCKETLRWFC